MPALFAVLSNRVGRRRKFWEVSCILTTSVIVYCLVLTVSSAYSVSKILPLVYEQVAYVGPFYCRSRCTLAESHAVPC